MILSSEPQNKPNKPSPNRSDCEFDFCGSADLKHSTWATTLPDFKHDESRVIIYLSDASDFFGCLPFVGHL